MASEYTVNESDLISVADSIRAKREITKQLMWPDEYKAEIEAISGADLNFEVVGGTTEPTNPTENTIWVNTDAEITGWVFSGSEPSDPVEGTVWIFTVNSSPVQINVLNEGAILIELAAVYQYVSGEWTYLEAYVFVNGEWLLCGKSYYFLSGEGSKIGTISTIHSNTSGYNYITYDKNSIKFVMTTSTYVSGVAYFPAIDLTHIKTLYFDIQPTTQLFYIGAAASVTSYSPTFAASSSINGGSSRKTVSVDVSKLTGSYHICAKGNTYYTTGTSYIYNIWGEYI